MLAGIAGDRVAHQADGALVAAFAERGEQGPVLSKSPRSSGWIKPLVQAWQSVCAPLIVTAKILGGVRHRRQIDAQGVKLGRTGRLSAHCDARGPQDYRQCSRGDKHSYFSSRIPMSFIVLRSQASDFSIIGPPCPSHSMLSTPLKP